MRPRSRPGPKAAWLALGVGLGYAAVSAYWAVGGTALMGTVGGVFERAGRSGGAGVELLLWFVVAVKVVAAALPLVAIRRLRRPLRVLAWIEAATLTGYGLVLTAVGLLVQADVIVASTDADHRALAWHAYLWDPWFLVWGLLVFAALLCRPQQRGAGQGWQ
ncbi:MAG: DUF3995 domain-containing protein [Acidimicrobiales bacterium]